jgi:nitrite reductase/ring-hydroxylating ferredoxin subunit
VNRRSDPRVESAKPPLRRTYKPVPHEGEDGLFRQTWYAVCKSSDVPAGAVIGRSFLDGRVAVYRGADGRAQVVNAYCPHLGADLSQGTVVGSSLRCAFHHWEFGRDGRCLRTGIGDLPPPTARLFNFPTEETFGIIWAFNGFEPLFDLASPSRPFERLTSLVADPFQVAADPWVICCNTPDWVHFATVHRFEFPREGQNESLRFEPFGVRRQFSARLEHGAGPEITFSVTVRGTTLVLIEGLTEGKWFAVAACLGVPRPGCCDFFVVTMVDRGEASSDAEAEALVRSYADVVARMGAEDTPIWNGMHFKPGALTRSDRALARYLRDLRRFPRAHPSADFIN